MDFHQNIEIAFCLGDAMAGPLPLLFVCASPTKATYLLIEVGVKKVDRYLSNSSAQPSTGIGMSRASLCFLAVATFNVQ